MAIFTPAGEAIINTTFTGGTRAEVADGIKAALAAAGWTTVSGAAGDWTMQCPATEQGYAMRLRMRDSGAGSSARLTIQSEDGAIQGNDMFLLPETGKVFRVIAHRHQVFVMVPGSFYVGREFFAAGVPYVIPANAPYFSRVIWSQGNGGSDTDTANYWSFRRALGPSATAPGNAIQNIIVNSLLLGYPVATSSQALVALGQLLGSWYSNTNAEPGNQVTRLANGSYLLNDASIWFGHALPPTAALVTNAWFFGWVWNAFLCSAPMRGDRVVTIGSQNFMAITHLNEGTIDGLGLARSSGGTLLLRVS